MINSLAWKSNLGDARQGPPARDRLDTWKEIASYLKREVRTVQRWEKEEGLPIHRHVHQTLPTVYAYTKELDRWWHCKIRDAGSRERTFTISRRRYHFLLLLATTSVVITILTLAWSEMIDHRRISPAGATDKNDRPFPSVFVAKLENGTGDSMLESAFEHALIQELEQAQIPVVQSRTMASATGERANSGLESGGVSLAGFSSEQATSPIILRPQLMSSGSAFLFRVDIVDPSQGYSTVTVSSTARQPDQIFPALVQLAQTVVEALSLHVTGEV